MKKRDRVDLPIEIAVEIEEVDGGIGINRIQGIPYRLMEASRNTGGCIGVILLGLREINPVNDGRLQRELTVGVLEIGVPHAASWSDLRISTFGIEQIIDLMLGWNGT